METLKHGLGCGDAPCAPCAAKRAQQLGGTVATLDPAVASALPLFDLVTGMVGLPPVVSAAVKTVVGVASPVSPEDQAAFARLVTQWAEIDAALFDPSTRGDTKAQIEAARKQWGSFQRLWNAAQRDPAALRKQLAVADGLLATIQAAKAAGVDTSVKSPSLWKSIPMVAIGGAAVLVGGAVVLIAGRK